MKLRRAAALCASRRLRRLSARRCSSARTAAAFFSRSSSSSLASSVARVCRNLRSPAPLPARSGHRVRSAAAAAAAAAAAVAVAGEACGRRPIGARLASGSASDPGFSAAAAAAADREGDRAQAHEEEEGAPWSSARRPSWRPRRPSSPPRGSAAACGCAWRPGWCPHTRRPSPSRRLCCERECACAGHPLLRARAPRLADVAGGRSRPAVAAARPAYYYYYRSIGRSVARSMMPCRSTAAHYRPVRGAAPPRARSSRRRGRELARTPRAALGWRRGARGAQSATPPGDDHAAADDDDADARIDASESA
eukprot:scaffold1803_cov320-Prasinococcus_capsulatus_cf.AAC.8